MKETLKKQRAALRRKMKTHDEALAKMINVRTRDTILKILRDYLQQIES